MLDKRDKMFKSRMYKKKGVTGITVLFVMIAILLVAIILSSVFLKYSINTKNKAGIMFEQVKTETSSAFKILEIAGTDGRNGYLSEFTEMMRILPGSSDVTLSDCSLIMSTDDRRTTLNYKAEGLVELSNTGYNTWTEEEMDTINIGVWQVLEEDLDDDNLDDYVTVNGSHVLFNISGNDNNLSIVPLNSNNLSLDITHGNQTIFSYGEIEEESIVYGYLNASGFNENKSLIDKPVQFKIIPSNLNQGYFVVEYALRDGIPLDGVLKDGDTIILYIQSFRNIYSDDFVSFNFVCPGIISITKKVFTGHTLQRQNKIVLYPQI